jgi:Sec-independent protein translocase protein TatA
MEFLGIGPLELVFILIIMLIVIGPNDMARSMRSLGRSLNRLYRSEAWRALTDASRNLRNLPNRLAREAALEELDALHREVDTPQREGRHVARQGIDEGLRAWIEPPQEETSIRPPQASERDGQDPAPGPSEVD